MRQVLSGAVFLWTLAVTANSSASEWSTKTSRPLRTVVDLVIGEEQEVKLTNGTLVTVRLLDVKESRDNVVGAIRDVFVKVNVNGREATLHSANYNLPRTVGHVQMDCPITRGYYINEGEVDRWGLEKDARIRLWPSGSPFVKGGTFVYPLRQRWFASDTHMSNEPVFVNGGEYPRRQIYYHSGLDFGGCEDLVEVVSATRGMVVSSGTNVLPGYEKTPVRPRYDVVYVLDDRGWYYRYSHLASIDPAIKPGVVVQPGETVGMLGKEGGSGGWSHLHFEIKCKQPSGKWGTEEGYAYIWEAYQGQYKPAVVAVARPHHLVGVGETVGLDGTKSSSITGKIAAYEWKLSDGRTVYGATQLMSYNRPGTYSEALKVEDDNGHVDFDFTVVQVIDPALAPSMQVFPAIHACFYPTFNLQAGQRVLFKVRSFNVHDGHETWDFGDGSPLVEVQSRVHFPGKVASFIGAKGTSDKVEYDPMAYAQVAHGFQKPGHYIVKVTRTDGRGYTAVAQLHVPVGVQ